MASDCHYLAHQWILNNLINQAIKQASRCFSLFVIVMRVDVTLYVQILIKFTTFQQQIRYNCILRLFNECLNVQIAVN